MGGGADGLHQVLIEDGIPFTPTLRRLPINTWLLFEFFADPTCRFDLLDVLPSIRILARSTVRPNSDSMEMIEV
jgi:hypothetical protein